MPATPVPPLVTTTVTKEPPRCPKCGSDDYSLTLYRAPGVASDDHTCGWMECAECGHKTDPS